MENLASKAETMEVDKVNKFFEQFIAYIYFGLEYSQKAGSYGSILDENFRLLL